MPPAPRQLVPAKIALLIVLTCVAYLPALQGGFIFDDEALLTNNPLVKAPDGLQRIWFTNEAIDYWPMTNTSFWIEWRLWGTNPTGYHVTNLVLHIVAALLVWRILLGLAIPGGFLAALVFAVHPVNVESVAWIAQRKESLAMVFFLLSILFYVRADERRLGIWYWLSLVFFLLAMLSKGTVAAAPVVLLLVVWWRRGRIGMGEVMRVAPFFVVACALTAVNLWFRTHGSDYVFRDAGFGERVAGAGAVVWFYLSKAVLPICLMFVYPQWHVQVGNILWWLPLAGAAVVTAALALKCTSRDAKRARALLFAWGFFCVALVPVLGIADVAFMQFTLVADHYQHIALIGVAALAAAGWSVWRDRAKEEHRWGANAIAMMLIGTLAFLSWEQNRLYADAVKLYEATLDKNPDCWLVHYNLGVEVDKRGDIPAALAHYQKAVELSPNFVMVRNNLGIALSRTGRTEEAIECFKESLKIQPNRATTHCNLGIALAIVNRSEEAAEQYRRAVQLKPDYVEAWANLATVYADLNRWDQAFAAANKGLELARSQGLAELVDKIEAWRNANATKQGN